MSHVKRDLERWFAEGWRFRIKTSRGHRYITRRRGGRERSLGRYTDRLWTQIEELTRPPPTPSPSEFDRLRANVEAIATQLNQLTTDLRAAKAQFTTTRNLDAIQIMRDMERWRMRRFPCKHLHKEGYCTFSAFRTIRKMSPTQVEVTLDGRKMYCYYMLDKLE